jgi:hypothetical protein
MQKLREYENDPIIQKQKYEYVEEHRTKTFREYMMSSPHGQYPYVETS